MFNFKTLWGRMIDLVFPKQCVKCGKYDSYLCKHCKKLEIQLVAEQFCHVCRFPLNRQQELHESCRVQTDLDRVFVCVRYSKLVEKILKEVKYHYHFDFVYLICDLMLEVLDIKFLYNSYLVPIPLYKSKVKKRGFNQAELIAIELEKRIGKKVGCQVQNLVLRNRNTKTQVGMSREERTQNLQDVFEYVDDLRSKMVSRGRRVVIVDDVMTTGTTLEECARVLKSQGFESVCALVFARG
jgi:competence protein ComFC